MTDSTAPAVDARTEALRLRLDRLEGFLRQDPDNQSLLIDAFETALACGEWERAGFHLQHGQTLQSEPLAWRLREGDFWLAQQRYDEALEVLGALAGEPNPPNGFAAVLLHNLAFVDLKRGRYQACIARLAPVMESAHDAIAASAEEPVANSALQQLWLRALHHDGELARAMKWALDAERQEMLDARAADVASLIAIDASDFVSAQRWVAAGSADGSVEALVTQASLALAARDASRSIAFADAALKLQPGDGRAWSTRAFASLLGGDLTAASSAFAHALSTMATHIGTWHGQGWTKILQGDLPAARSSFEAALALDRNFAESHGGLAVVLAMQHARQGAEEHAELALRLDGRNLSGRYAQALLSGEVKDVNDLRRLAGRLLGGRAGPLGGQMTDLLPPDEPKGR